LSQEDALQWPVLHNIDVMYNSIGYHADNLPDLFSKRVIAVGALSYEKGYERLIDAWGKVKKDFPDWTLSIFGDSMERNMLQEKIDLSGLNDVITLQLPVSDIISEYKKSSIFVMSSMWEGLPMALLKAKGCGLPVVAFACKCGPKDIAVDGIDVFLVKEGDTGELSIKLMLLMKDKFLLQQFFMHALNDAGRFSERTIMHKWNSIFNS
jgi:glycosyltransferase involved in cell wall biosynthesis